MIQHLIAVAAALWIGIWSTAADRVDEFQVPPPEVPALETAVIEVPTPFETVVADFVRAASSTQTTPAVPPVSIGPKPVPTTTPQIPFKPVPVPVIPPIPTPVPPVVTPPTPTVDSTASTEALLRGSIVNIICLPGGGIRGASGSGVVIDPRGIILTVAHVAQNFLLTDYPTKNAGSCYIRTGSPAKNAYSAELIYISSDWVKENPGTFLSSRPTGTGENDFAFVAITGSLTSIPVSTMSHVPFSSPGTKIDIKDQVGIGSYAAEFLTSSQVRSSLYPTISFAPVNDVYTFGNKTLDIFSVRAGSAAQEGSSGGAVVNEGKKLIGLISTRTVKADLSLRDLQAVTVDHIRRSFKADMNADLDAYLKSSVPVLIANFESRSETLLDVLEKAIEEDQ